MKTHITPYYKNITYDVITNALEDIAANMKYGINSNIATV
jgi:hypothetical protein|tara:strand:- start:1203 stop:1322 length:120 start_codon:yes stop_codon:yes gene_type:complete